MLICFDLHALYPMPCFPLLCSSFHSRLMLGLRAHMFVWCCWLCLAWIYVFMCLFPCYVFRSLSLHAYMLGFMFFHVYVLGFHMRTCIFPCLYVQIDVFTCLDLCSLHSLYYLPYASVFVHVLHASSTCLMIYAML